MKIFDVDRKLIGIDEQTRGNLFYLDPIISTCLFYKVEYVWLWHKRLYHVDFDNMVKVSRKKKVRDLLNLHKPDNAMCKEC